MVSISWINLKSCLFRINYSTARYIRNSQTMKNMPREYHVFVVRQQNQSLAYLSEIYTKLDNDCQLLKSVLQDLKKSYPPYQQTGFKLKINSLLNHFKLTFSKSHATATTFHRYINPNYSMNHCIDKSVPTNVDIPFF